MFATLFGTFGTFGTFETFGTFLDPGNNVPGQHRVGQQAARDTVDSHPLISILSCKRDTCLCQIPSTMSVEDERTWETLGRHDNVREPSQENAT